MITKAENEQDELATRQTSNHMLDNGLWRAPVLTSTDPLQDPRAAHAVHFFAEDAAFSMCGGRFAAEHYVAWESDKYDRRRKCHGCAGLLSTTQLHNRMAKSLAITLPRKTVYPGDEFTALISGNGGLALRITRAKLIDHALYLFADFGLTAKPALRLALQRITLAGNVDEFVIVWASKPPQKISRDPRIARNGGIGIPQQTGWHEFGTTLLADEPAAEE